MLPTAAGKMSSGDTHSLPSLKTLQNRKEKKIKEKGKLFCY